MAFQYLILCIFLCFCFLFPFASSFFQMSLDSFFLGVVVIVFRFCCLLLSLFMSFLHFLNYFLLFRISLLILTTFLFPHSSPLCRVFINIHTFHGNKPTNTKRTRNAWRHPRTRSFYNNKLKTSNEPKILATRSRTLGKKQIDVKHFVTAFPPLLVFPLQRRNYSFLLVGGRRTLNL